MLTQIIRYFAVFPYFVFALLMVVFVLRLRIGWLGKVLWAAFLAACCSKFLFFKCLGGSAFVPNLPDKLIWVWNLGYSGAVILCVLSLVFFFRFPRRGTVLGIAAWTLAAIGVWNGIRDPIVREVEIAVADLPETLDGYRIAQLSDLHASYAALGWRTRRVVDIANATHADLICLTGDYVDGKAENIHYALAPIADLRARDGVFAVSGNHDHFRGYDGWWRLYREWKIRFLANECVFPRPGLALGGVNDFQVGIRRSQPQGAAFPDVAAAFAAATNGEYRVLLQHQPRQAHGNIEGHGVRLQLSGHTHGGIMPLFSEIVRRHNGGMVRGRYDYPHGTLYVNPGCGQWAGFPIRFCNPSEITVIRLTKKP